MTHPLQGAEAGRNPASCPRSPGARWWGLPPKAWESFEVVNHAKKAQRHQDQLAHRPATSLPPRPQLAQLPSVPGAAASPCQAAAEGLWRRHAVFPQQVTPLTLPS